MYIHNTHWVSVLYTYRCVCARDMNDNNDDKDNDVDKKGMLLLPTLTIITIIE